MNGRKASRGGPTSHTWRQIGGMARHMIIIWVSTGSALSGIHFSLEPSDNRIIPGLNAIFPRSFPRPQDPGREKSDIKNHQNRYDDYTSIFSMSRSWKVQRDALSYYNVKDFWGLFVMLRFGDPFCPGSNVALRDRAGAGISTAPQGRGGVPCNAQCISKLRRWRASQRQVSARVPCSELLRKLRQWQHRILRNPKWIGKSR